MAISDKRQFARFIFGDLVIRNTVTRSLVGRLDTVRPVALRKRFRAWLRQSLGNRRLVRYSLVSFNVVLLLAIAWFTLGPTHSGRPLGQQGVVTTTNNDSAVEPLDQLSSADIAVNVSLAAGLYETSGVINQADSVKAEQAIAPADTTVIAKPQLVATPFKSRKDIKDYVVLAGDTVSSIAAKFSVTSDSIMWSNNLHGNTVNAGLQLVIPPSGVSGIVYTVRGGDTVDTLAQKYRASKDQIVLFNDIEITGLKVGDRILIPNGQLPAPVVPARPLFASFGYNGYDYGFCTWYVANRRAQIGRPLPANLGNARTWDERAAGMGISVDRHAAVGDAVVTSQTGDGHVAFVEAINADGSVWVTEMNSSGQKSMTNTDHAGGWGSVDWKLLPADRSGTYNYIH